MFSLEVLNERLDELVEWEPRLTYTTLIGFDGRLEVFIEDEDNIFEDAYYLPESILGDMARCNQLLTHRIAQNVSDYHNSLEE